MKYKQVLKELKNKRNNKLFVKIAEVEKVYNLLLKKQK